MARGWRFGDGSGKGLEASRGWRNAVWLVAAFAGVVGCSQPPASATVCLDGTHDKDCIAVARLVLADGKNVAPGDTVPVSVTGVAVGKTTEISLDLLNATSIATAAGLHVEHITLQPLDGQSLDFECRTAADQDCSHLGDVLVVPAGLASGTHRVEHLPFRMIFHRPDAQPRRALVTLETSGDPKLPSLQFILATHQGSPSLSVTPTHLDFPYVQPGKTSADQALTLRNVGNSPLTVTRFTLEGSPTFAIAAQGQTWTKSATLSTPWVLPAGAELAVQVRFMPDAAQKREATVRFFSDDAQQPEGTPVLLTGNTSVPCVKIKPAALDFGQALVGEKRTAATEVSNCGTASLQVLSAALGAGTPATFSLTPLAPVVLKTNAVAKVQLSWTPQSVPPPDAQGKATHEKGTVVVQTSAGPVTATLDGVAVANKCPIAVVKVAEGEEVAPQTELHLIGSGSHTATGGAVAKYQWSVTQPEGSKQVFVKSVTSADNLFVPNVVGEYKFCLNVWDAAGQASCDLACQTVAVIPDGCGVHVELTWNTPGDIDQTDSGPDAGADLDLHVASALATGADQDCDGAPDPWFNNPFDAFWFNPHPNWGSYDPNTLDDPSLDLDDTDGAGPENMNLGCDMTDDLSIGVHYWNDHGYGTSLATLRVFLGGAKILDIAQVALDPLDMWYVGKLKMPVGSGPGSSAPLQVCHQSGDACMAKKLPGSPQGGKMWQATGDWCRTPCYEPVGLTGAAASPATCKP